MYSSRVPQKVDSQEGELDLEFYLSVQMRIQNPV